ncbi:uncharacterized protein TNCV_2743221 [Trichonephila clavipes]|nr:uncharacterized protein TNCV_2743221 [Trichonephila clavipes]
MSNFSHSEEESVEILKEKLLTLDKKLEKAIYSKTKVLYCSTKKSTCSNKIMKQWMQLFDSTENPSPNFIKLCEALKTITPTSFEADRAFYDAALFVTKLRIRLSDESINCREWKKPGKTETLFGTSISKTIEPVKYSKAAVINVYGGSEFQSRKLGLNVRFGVITG